MEVIDYENMLAVCPQALELYKQRGIDDLVAAFDIANVLATNYHYDEAAFFYKHAYNLHSKSSNQYPLAHFLLMARLVILLKGNLPMKEEELNELKGLCTPLYNFVIGWRLYKENNDAVSAIDLMKNCYEEFHTGEEADSIYLTIMMDLFNSRPDLSIRSRLVGSADFSNIPNNLFFYWDNDPPPEIAENFEFHKQMGHFNLRIFDKAEATEWLYQNYGVEARQVFLSARHPAEAADFLRVHVINYYGGWWLDADIKIKSIDKFYSTIPSVYDHVFLLTYNNVVHNDFFGSVRNSPVLNDCLLSLYRNSYLHSGLFIAYKTGPGIFSRALNRQFYRCIRGESEKLSCVLLDHHKFDDVIEQFNAPYKTSRISWQAV